MLNIKNIHFSYVDKKVVKGISEKIISGEFISVIGVNGSGKSTFLNCVYGGLELQKGQIFWNDKRIKGPKESLIPGHSGFKLVSQDSKVNEYMTVQENLEMSFKQKSKSFVKKRITELLNQFGLKKNRHIKACDLSGGLRQRLALTCALAADPEVLLLDEPFSQIDFHNTFVMLSILNKIRKENRLTIIYVSHETSGIMYVSDRILVLDKGRVIQRGYPDEIYRLPKNETVAGLTGLYSVINNEIYRPENIIIAPEGIPVSVINKFTYNQKTILECKNNKGEVYYLYETNKFNQNDKITIAPV